MPPYNGVYHKKKCKFAPLRRKHNGFFFYPLRIFYGELLESKNPGIRVSAFAFYPLAGNKRNVLLTFSDP